MSIRMRAAVALAAVALGVAQVVTTLAAFGWVPI